MVKPDHVHNRHEAKLDKESLPFYFRSIEESTDAGRGMAARRSQANQCAYTAIDQHIRKRTAPTGGRTGPMLMTIDRPDDPLHIPRPDIVLIMQYAPHRHDSRLIQPFHTYPASPYGLDIGWPVSGDVETVVPECPAGKNRQWLVNGGAAIKSHNHTSER